MNKETEEYTGPVQKFKSEVGSLKSVKISSLNPVTLEPSAQEVKLNGSFMIDFSRLDEFSTALNELIKEYESENY